MFENIGRPAALGSIELTGRPACAHGFMIIVGLGRRWHNLECKLGSLMCSHPLMAAQPPARGVPFDHHHYDHGTINRPCRAALGS